MTGKEDSLINVFVGEYFSARFDTSITGLSKGEPYWQEVGIFALIPTVLWVVVVCTAMKFGFKSDAVIMLSVFAVVFSLPTAMNIFLNISIIFTAILSTIEHYWLHLINK